LLVVNGYDKTAQLFKANSRVKEATLIINRKQKMKVVLADDPEQQWIKLDQIKGKVKSIQLVINGVYPGTKYKDTCISQLSLIERLKEEPKHYGAR